MLTEVITPRSAARVTGMVRLAPHPDVADVLEGHWVVTWDRGGRSPVSREVLPDPCINLAVEPAGRFLYGLGSGHSVRELGGAGMVVGTKFRPGGFSGFIPGPLSELRGRVLSLSEAFGADGEDLDVALASAPDIAAVVEEVTAFLRAHRPPPDPQRELAMRIAAAMRTAGPDATVNALAAEFAVSPRTMQRLFARHVGAGAKHVLQRFRRQRAVDLLREPEPASLARIAAELGYADHAHLTRDFRAALGQAPSALA